MKNKKYLIKFLALCLSLTLFVLTIPVGTGFAAAGLLPTEGTDYFVGETVLNTDFEGLATGEMPDGWFSDKTNLGWSLNNGSEKYYGGAVTVGEGDAADQVLHFGTSNSDGWLMTDKLPVGNYIYETELTVFKGAGSLGISTQAFGDINNFTGATSLITYCADANVTDAEKNTFTVGGKGSVASAENIAFPDGQGALNVGDTVKFKIISFEGYNHYFMNDQYLTSVSNGSVNSKYGYERVGFYTYHGQYYINSMKVTAIYTPIEYEGAAGPREGVDFIAGDELMADWYTNYTALACKNWWADKPADVAANDDGTITFSSTCDAMLGFSKIDVADYVMEATVTHTGLSSLQFFNNLSAAVPLEAYDAYGQNSATVNATITGMYSESWNTNLAGKPPVIYRNRYPDRGIDSGEQYYQNLPAAYDQPAQGEKYTIKLICLGGVNYLYYNGIYLGCFEIANYQAGNTYAGFYICNGSLILHSFSVKTLKAPPSFDKGVVSDGVIIDEDFTSYEVGAFPENWDKATDKYGNFLWKTDNADYTAKVASSGNDKFLEISASSGAHILTLPDLGTENYVLSANVGFQTFGAAFGLATNIKTESDEAKLATIFQLYSADIDAIIGTEDWKGEYPIFSTYVRGGSGTQVSNAKTDPAIDLYLPNMVKNITKTTGGAEVDKSQYRIGTVADGAIFKLTVYHLNGVSYFFVNDVYVSQMADQCKDPATKAGFYICTAGQVMRIYDVKAEAITDMNNFGDTLSLGAPVVNENFAKVAEGAKPAGWELVATGWTWNGNKGTAAVTTVDGVKGLKVTATGGTAALVLPDFGLSDYKVEMEGKLLNNVGSTGLLANISAPAAESGGATHMISYVGASYDAGKDTYHYNRSGGAQNQRIYGTLSEAGLNHIAQGDTFKMTAYVIDGETYFFVNDRFISKNIDGYSLETSLAGIYSCNAEVLITNVTLAGVSKKGFTQAVVVDNVSLGYSDSYNNSENAGAAGLGFKLSLNKKDGFYTSNVNGDYLGGEDFQVGFVAYLGDTAENLLITNNTAGAMEFAFDKFTQDAEKVYFEFKLIALGSKVDKYLNLRPFIKVDGSYYYGTTVVAGAANEANKLYGATDTTDELKATLDKVFGQSDIFLGANAKSVTFTVFSDFHYQEGQYMSSLDDLNSILNRAKQSNSAFVLSAGDFCNNFRGSPELTNLWLNNTQGLDVYNIYGNHELESSNNDMGYVTPRLTNDANVVWGTADGKIGDGSIAYYYTDKAGFRIVCTDTNYSWNPTKKVWEHNTTCSYGPPAGNVDYNSLGPVQLEWLEEVLVDAANKGIPCIVMSHESFAGKFATTSPDGEAIRAIYAKANGIRKGTVLMSINGHIHTNHQAIVDGVFYLDMNTVRNCVWLGGQTENHYNDSHTFTKVYYNNDGSVNRTDYNAKLSSLSMGMATWFAADPLSAVITLDQYGNVKIEGVESTWIYGVEPPRTNDGEEPRVLSGQWKLDY